MSSSTTTLNSVVFSYIFLSDSAALLTLTAELTCTLCKLVKKIMICHFVLSVPHLLLGQPCSPPVSCISAWQVSSSDNTKALHESQREGTVTAAAAVAGRQATPSAVCLLLPSSSASAPGLAASWQAASARAQQTALPACPAA